MTSNEVFLIFESRHPSLADLLMGNVSDTLTKHVFNRRQNSNVASRLQVNHPERLSPDQLPTLPMDITSMISTPEDRTFIGVDALEIVSPSNKCSDFYLSCRNNQIQQVKQLLRTITFDEMNKIEPNGSTALHSASYHGHYEIVKLLLEAGVDRAIPNKYQCLPFDEAANDEIKNLFLRITDSNRLVSSTGVIEWNLINNNLLETVRQERCMIESIYKNTIGYTSPAEIFEKIEIYINNGLAYFHGIDHIKHFFRKATEEQNPSWIIKAYTAETDFYQILNTDIIYGTNQYQDEQKYIITLLWHHPKLDPLAYIGSSYRLVQINYNHLQKYQIDCSLMTKSCLSSSIDRKIVELFLMRKKSTQQQQVVRTKIDGTSTKLWLMCIYHIKYQRSALYIENISQYAMEGEILIRPYSVFKVKRVGHITPSSLSTGQTMTEIELEQIQ